MAASAKPDAALASTLKRLRTDRGVTQEDLAHRAEITVAAYARIERGKANPTWTTILSLIAAFEIDVTDFAVEYEYPS